jgi:CubicO group peptidase (beta-lactamase class C family)
LDGQKIVSEAGVQAMAAVHTGDLAAGHEPGLGWGLGVEVVRRPEQSTAMLSPGAFGHGGAFGPQIWIDPKQDLFVVLLIARMDLSNAESGEIRGGVAAAAIAQSQERKTDHVESKR